MLDFHQPHPSHVLYYRNEIYAALELNDILKPREHPMLNGGILLEWNQSNDEVGVAIEPDETIYLINVNTASGEARALKFVFEDGIDKIIEFLNTFDL